MIATGAEPKAIAFADGAAANRLVAGVPAAARAIAVAARLGWAQPIRIVAPGGWQPDGLCRTEAERLAPGVSWQTGDFDRIDSGDWIGGAAVQAMPPAPIDAGQRGVAADDAALRAAARRVVTATGKAGDGIVSRHINRPISQAITMVVLRFAAARPDHATAAAAAIGVAMLAALLFGGASGLLIGALLFQIASIVDGVDGEMARATMRSSDRGAMLDSVTDAATNLGFIGGVSCNLYLAGEHAAAAAGATGFALLALGQLLLGVQSRRDGGAFGFDALKHRMRARPSRVKQWLIWLTMRDFYAFAACVTIWAGAAVPLLFLFAGVAAGWLIVLCWTLAAGAYRKERG